MTAAEIIDRLTELVKLQADIIRDQADALSQLVAVDGLDERIACADRERQVVVED